MILNTLIMTQTLFYGIYIASRKNIHARRTWSGVTSKWENIKRNVEPWRSDIYEISSHSGVPKSSQRPTQIVFERSHCGRWAVGYLVVLIWSLRCHQVVPYCKNWSPWSLIRHDAVPKLPPTFRQSLTAEGFVTWTGSHVPSRLGQAEDALHSKVHSQ